ncbi:MAG: hypothetical protein JXR37_18100 [Kiritimatiellae bacterium]|nr:hypothetical protein [Kiritimatiellia bacterium]
MDKKDERIHNALAEVKTIDPHCHLRLAKPAADHLADIVLYHHIWIELVSSGMDEHEVSQAGLPHECADPGIAPLERVRRALPHLKNIRNTTLGLYLRWVWQDLYGLEPELTDQNLQKAWDLVAAKGADPAWQEEVLRERCGIEASISVENATEPYSEKMLRGREWAPFRLDFGKQSPQDVLRSMDKQLGREINSADDYREFLANGVDALPIDDLKFVGFWLSSHLTNRRIRDAEVSAIIGKVREQAPLQPDELGSFAFFGMVNALESLRRTSLRTIQVIVGANCLLPHRSITYWGQNWAEGLGRVAGAFPEFHFSASSASDLYTQDLAILGKHVPNISVIGYWWHTLYPFYIRKAVETRLDMVPLNKIVAFFSDAYHAEWCYPKLKMVKQIWGDVLSERVAKGWLAPDAAVDVVRAVFYENPRRIYGLNGS